MKANNKDLVSELSRMCRFLLGETPTLVGAPLLFTAGLTMIYGDDFLLGTIVVCLTAAWGIAGWWLSSELQRRKPQLPKKQRYALIEKYKQGRHRFLLWKFAIPLPIVAAMGLSVLLVNGRRQAKILREYEGFLMPADKPDPPSFCSGDKTLFGVGKDALKVFMGRNEAFSSHFPFVVLRVHKKDRIVIDRDETGRIALSMDILDSQGRVVVTFEKGHFTVVQANILDMKRPDRSTLIVRDQYKNEVLNIRYLNKKSLLVSGVLRYPDEGPIMIPMAPAVDGICVGNSQVAFDLE